ncbi:MAG TPA: glycosyltransferase family 4 protein, partial [Gemmatimonadales bacterium]|nr:glycosyltransferase family 4 protein [Gemmatimonadales bacterium]
MSEPERLPSVLMVTSEWPRKPGHTAHFVARQVRFLEAAGVRVEVVPFRGAKHPGKYAAAWLRVRQRLKRGGFDLVHAQFGQSALVAFPKRLPLVVTFRGDDLLGIVGEGGRKTWGGRVLQWLSRLVARRANQIIVVSRHMTDGLASRAPVHVVPSGIDLELFRPMPQVAARARLSLAQYERLVLFVGDPADPRKRGDLARDAVARLPATLRARLFLAWKVPHTEMPYYFAAADVLVFTSLQEGSPNAVKEALACDLPVVSVSVGDVAERLQDVPGCEVCPDDRPETIAAALGRVLARGGRVAGRAAVSNLDERLLTQQVIAIYHAALQ